MRWLLLVLGILLALRVGAQDFQGDARRVVDSLAARWASDSSGNALVANDEYWVLLQDSLEKAFAAEHVRMLARKGHYTWPGWYLGYSSSGKTGIPTSCGELTETGRYLLEAEYRISMDGVSNGCVWQAAFVYHDSLMAEAIRSRYGADFFGKYCQLASTLDAKKEGLRLPYLRHDSLTSAHLNRAYAFVPQLQSPEASDGRGCYLTFRFKNGQVDRVCICRRVYYIQQDLYLMDKSERLTAIARKLKWMPPRFRNKPVDATVVYDMDRGTLAFYRGASFF